MAARVGTCANASILAAQLLRIRESWTSDVWARTGKIQLASTFLASMIVGEWVNMGEAEACATGMWAHTGGQGSSTQGHWDEGVLEIVGGSREEGRRIRGWLGEVDSASGRKIANVSRYLCERFGFEPGACRACLHRPSRLIYRFMLLWFSQTPSSHHLRLIIFLDIFLFVRRLETPYYRLDPWIASSHPRNTIIPLAFTTYSHIQHRTLEKSEDTSPC